VLTEPPRNCQLRRPSTDYSRSLLAFPTLLRLRVVYTVVCSVVFAVRPMILVSMYQYRLANTSTGEAVYNTAIARHVIATLVLRVRVVTPWTLREHDTLSF
jgi:hypothetical protein